MSTTQKALEHSEHAHHHAHGGNFDKIVGMSMSIVAALLAGVTLLSHRSHTETLRLTSEASRLNIEANIQHTKSSDQWNFYQTKKQRSYQFAANAELLGVLAKDPAQAARTEALRAEWKDKVVKLEAEIDSIKKEAERLAIEGDQNEEVADGMLVKAESFHHRSNRYDLAELLVEIALVLCSVAVLTKTRWFWLLGMILAAASAVTATSGLLMKLHDPKAAIHSPKADDGKPPPAGEPPPTDSPGAKHAPG